jgi:hypothetical protein
MTDNPLERYRKMFEDAEHTVDYWREAAKNCGESRGEEAAGCFALD